MPTMEDNLCEVHRFHVCPLASFGNPILMWNTGYDLMSMLLFKQCICVQPIYAQLNSNITKHRAPPVTSCEKKSTFSFSEAFQSPQLIVSLMGIKGSS